ncbi:MAG: hypothetical protein EOM26_08355 [Alphaproteobacteria bacterium]|nr:hypothetical protein [Alphaproteobacteria bacterium]
MKKSHKRMVVITVPVIVTLILFGGLLALILPAAGSLEKRNLAYADAPKPSCDFSKFSGHEVDEAALEATGREYRILPPGSMYTEDYNPRRVNLDVNDEGIVISVWCG